MLNLYLAIHFNANVTFIIARTSAYVMVGLGTRLARTGNYNVCVRVPFQTIPYLYLKNMYMKETS